MRGGDWPVYRHQRPFIQRMYDVAVSRSLVFVLLMPKSPKTASADLFVNAEPYVKNFVRSVAVPTKANPDLVGHTQEILHRLAGSTIHRTKVLPSGEIDCR